MIALSDPQVAKKLENFKAGLKDKIVKANAELATVEYRYKVN
jgi:5-(carboxyamino)imidazole ribonucleotide mutase